MTLDIGLEDNLVTPNSPGPSPPITPPLTRGQDLILPLHENLLQHLQAFLTHYDEEFRIPCDNMQREIDTGKEAVANINALITVSAFIAGVQTQIISMTYTSNATPLQIATNAFAFLGLTLDIIGTSAGVLRTVLLQHTFGRSERVLQRLRKRLDRLRGQIQRLSDQGSTTHDTLRKIKDQIRVQNRMLREFQNIYSLSSKVTFTRLWFNDANVAATFPNVMTVLRLLLYIVRSPQAMANQLPLTSMGGGVLCLLVSIFLFAAGSQPTGVWTACVVIAGVVAVGSTLHMVFDGEGRQMRLANKKIDISLQKSSVLLSHPR